MSEVFRFGNNNNNNRVYQNTVGTLQINHTNRTIKKQHHEYRKKNNWCSKPKQLEANTAKLASFIRQNVFIHMFI